MKPHILFSTLLIFASFSFSSLEAKRLNLQIADSSGDNQGIQGFLRKNPSIPNIPGVDDFKNAPNMPIPEPFFSIPGIVSTENDSSFVLLNVLPIEIKEVIATNVTTR